MVLGSDGQDGSCVTIIVWLGARMSGPKNVCSYCTAETRLGGRVKAALKRKRRHDEQQDRDGQTQNRRADDERKAEAAA
jgi:hypothetical protein